VMFMATGTTSKQTGVPGVTEGNRWRDNDGGGTSSVGIIEQAPPDVLASR